MGSLKNILIQCQENEKDFERYGVVSRDRDVNRGWIECCQFFFNNFDIREKIINDNQQKGEQDGTV